MEASKVDRGVAVLLNGDEAVVLFDGTLERLPFGDQAEQRLIWDLSAALEPMIDEVFNLDYRDVVERARAAVRDLQ